MTKINSITIENVKGISSSKYIFDTPEMIANKLHILVAPNGFGKSSLASAFDSLKPKSLKIDSSLFHEENESNKPKLEINFVENGSTHTVSADDSKNEISKVFSIAVINCRIKPHAIARRSIMNQYARPTASLIVEPVILVEKVPSQPFESFTTKHFKETFGANGKILPNINDYLENSIFLNNLLSLDDINRFTQKTIWKKIDPIIESINSQSASTETLINWIQIHKLQDLQNISELASIANILKVFAELSDVKRFLVAYQFAKAYQENPKLLKQHCEWRSYKVGKQRCKDLLQSINSNPNWINVSIEQTGGQLIVSFPTASKMSNGQRDLFSFISQLMKLEFKLTGSRALLIVDEIFDYLDECNLLAAQFYISKFIDKFKSTGAEIFPIFLTHLDPYVFKHSVLGLGKSDLRKVHYLDKASDTSRRLGVAAMVKLREHDSLKAYIGKYFFHYHPDNCNQTSLFKAHSLKETWGESHKFYTYAIEEFSKYVSNNQSVDYVAACVGARIAIEKHAFDCLTEPKDKHHFTEDLNKGTVDKLNFVEGIGGDIPDSHRLLGLIYNDILHHKDHFDYISPIVSKMKNPAIRGMMAEIPIPAKF